MNEEAIKLDFDEYSPITANFTVLTEEIPNGDETLIYKLDYETGYQTYSGIWVEENVDYMANLENSMPKFTRELKHVDAHNDVWYPITYPHYRAVLHTIPDVEDVYQWALTRLTPILDASGLNDGNIMAMPFKFGEEEKLLYFKLDAEPFATFKWNDFTTAMDTFMAYTTNNEQSNEEE